MKHTKVLGVALVAALSGGLLVGCTSDNATTATAPTPPAQLLVGKWLAHFPDEPAFPNGEFVILELEEGGVWTYKWGPSYELAEQVGSGTYTVTADNTISWLGGACVTDVPGIYTYTLEGDKLTQTAKDEPCDPRRAAYDGETYTRETTSPSPFTS
jgi:hypothetical protein